jgi:hypothetical protein
MRGFAILVVEFLREGYIIRKVICKLKIKILKGNY